MDYNIHVDIKATSTHTQGTMINLFESQQDQSISWNGDQDELWGDVNPNNVSGADIADIIDMIGRPASAELTTSEYEEYRDEREDSSRLADRHGC